MPRRLDRSEGERRPAQRAKTSPRRRETAGISTSNPSVTEKRKDRRKLPCREAGELLILFQYWFTQLAMSHWGTSQAAMKTRKLAGVSEA